jgi:hypothetical protein
MQQARGHEMRMARGDASGDQGFLALEVDQAHIQAIAKEDVAVTALQGGAGDNGDGLKTSPYSNRHRRRAASSDPTVDLPDPETPITTMATGGGRCPTTTPEPPWLIASPPCAAAYRSTPSAGRRRAKP